MESSAAGQRSAGAVSADARLATTLSVGALLMDAGSASVSADAAFEAVVAAVTVLAGLRRPQREDHAGADPLRRSIDNSLDRLAAISRLEASTAALKVLTAAEYADGATALTPTGASPQEHTAHEMAAIAEVACALTISERAGSALLGEAHRLTTALPLTLAALQAGTVSWQHARIMADETTNLDPAGAAALEAHFLDPAAPNPARGPAGDLTPARFRAKAHAWRERHHPDSIEKRHTRSAADRRLEYSPDRDGMAWLSAYLPADQAAGIWDRTTTAARAMQGPTEPRTLTQLRADNAAAWLLGGQADQIPSPTAQVLVTVPVFALMGLTDEPATLDGYGPIPPSMARTLVADGATSFHRVLTDPRDGAPLEIGRTSYRVPQALRQWLRLRDGKCPFPGCNNQSLDNDADHLLAWHHGGTTGISNLGQPCPKHHRLRHTTAWKPTIATKNEPPGWTSPTGRHYQSEHPDWEPPTWPGQIVDQLPRQERGTSMPDSRAEPLHEGPAESPSEKPGPADTDPWWTWLRRHLEEPDPVPYASVPDLLWLTKQPLTGSGARSPAGITG